MRTSSEVVLGMGKNDYGTSNKNYFGWIQPKV